MQMLKTFALFSQFCGIFLQLAMFEL